MPKFIPLIPPESWTFARNVVSLDLSLATAHPSLS